MSTIATDSNKESSIIGTEKFNKKGTYNGKTLNEVINASNAEMATTIKGMGGSDTIIGSSHDDKLYGGSGDDTLYGGLGDDIITGGTGKNTIVFENNFGNDIVNLTKNENLILQYGKENNEFEVKGNNVVITNSDGTITLKNFAKKDILGSKGSIYFDEVNLKEVLYNSSSQVINKKSYSGKWLNEIIDASKNNNKITINGGGGNDIITGTNYNDTLYGGNGNDVIEGGKGNDKIYGGTGSNTLVFKEGAGKDTVYSGKGEDIIKLEGIKSSDVVISQVKNNLILSYEFDELGNVLSSITVKDYYKTNKKGKLTTSVKKIECLDSTIIIDGKGNGYIETDNSNNIVYGNLGNDTIICGNGNDIIDGGQGKDTIYGGAGKNTYIYTTNGFGEDTLILTGEKDTIKFAENADVSYELNGEDLIFIVNKSNKITVKNFITDNRSNKNIYYQIGNNEEIKISEQDFYITDEGIINNTDLNETIKGGIGENTYIYKNSEFGHDTLILTGEKEVLEFAPDIYLSYTLNKNDAIITLDENNTITIKDFMKDGVPNENIYIKFGSKDAEKLINFNFDIIGDTRIDGTILNETIIATNGSNRINGDGGNDTIFGGEGTNFIWGDDGDDTICGGNGTNYLEGGTGNDTIECGNGNDYVIGGEGDDIIIAGAGKNTFGYTDSNFGNDIINLSGSSNFMMTNRPQTTTNSEHTLKFAQDTNLTYKIIGNDVILSTNENNSITIRDFIVNGVPLDNIYLQFGENKPIKLNDKSFEIYGNGTITGTDMNETFIGSSENDTISGGGGKNTFIYTNSEFGNDILNLSGENDTIKFSEDTKLSYELVGNDAILTLDENNSITIKDFIIDGISNKNINLQFGENESITLSDKIFNTSGEGVISGSDLNENITGSDVNDIIEGGKGNDTIYGGAGENTYIYTSSDFGEDILYLTGDKDVLKFDKDTELSYTVKNNDVILKLDNDNTITLKNFIKNNIGNENIYLQFGENEPERLIDKSFYLSGEIKIDGTELNDTILGSNYADQINGKGGHDTIYGKGGSDIIFGQDGNDTIYGGDDNDFIWGYGGNDTIYGENGDDYIDGGEGINIVYGGEGNDTIYGGAGQDFLNGGNGNDTYIIDTLNNDNSVIISDTAGIDTLIVNDTYNNLNIFFDIKNDGTFTNTKNIQIVNDNWISNLKTNLTNSNNAIKIDCSENEFSPIEEIYTNDNYFITSTQLDELKENITSWLTNNNYTDVSSVFETGKQDDILSLISEFQNIDWQKSTVEVVH